MKIPEVDKRMRRQVTRTAFSVWPRVRRIWLLGFGALVLAFAAGCTPEAQIRFADGSQTQASHWEGRWLVINYWAEWCAPCREEIPELNELHHARVEHGLVLLGVNWDGLPQDKLAEVAARMGIEFPVLIQDPYQEYGYDRAEQLPVTVLINPAREVHQVLVGPQNEDSIMAAMRG